ncbi:MAG: S8 family serine peptidase [Eubacteriaceae bacterium]|nr:S8 family serine peptidase [Eubacteriaceae bacterium]
MKKTFILLLVFCAAAGIIGAAVSVAGTSQNLKTPSSVDAVITSTAQLPDISEDTPMAERVVVVYRDGGSLSSLGLTQKDVDAGSAVSDMVAVFHPADGNAEALIARLKANAQVESAFADDVVPCMAMPNDPEMSSTSNNVVARSVYTVTGADHTWRQVNGNSPVKVAVVDTGCNINHEDLSGRTENVIDEYYIKNQGTSANDLAYHGTQVCGILAASTNNSKGIAGMAGTANVKLVPYRCGGTYQDDTDLKLSCITASLKDIEDKSDIKVVNMSFGAIEGEAAAETINQIQSAVARCVAKGKIMVASAGNNGHDNSTHRNNLVYPAACDGVIAVGGVSCAGGGVTHWEGSPENSSIDVVAPAYCVRSTYTGNNYTTNTGTSFAAPVVAGEAAMLLADNPNLTAAQVTELITSTASDMGASGKDDTYGYGLVQFDKALAKAQNHKCGNALYWQVSSDGRTLTIMGSGAMTNFADASSVPWHASAGTIETVELPAGLTNIGDYALSGMTSLTSVTIPESVTVIGKGAFMGDNQLSALNDGVNTSNNGTPINIPNGIVSIGEKSFDGCSAFSSVYLPASVSGIGAGAFDDCENLEAFIVDASNQNFTAADGVLFNKSGTALVRYPENKTGESFAVQNTVTTIAAGAFADSKNLTSLTIPETVKTVGDNAFIDSKINTVYGTTNSAAQIAVAKHNSDQSNKITFVNENKESEIKAYPLASLYKMTPTSVTENGSPVSVTVNAAPDAGQFTAVKYNGSSTAPSAPGAYTVTVDTEANASYIAASNLAIGTLTIKAKPAPPSGGGGGGGGGGSSTPATTEKVQPTASLYVLTPSEAEATGEPIAVKVTAAEGENIGEVTAITITDAEGNAVAQIVEPGVYTVAVDTAETDVYTAAKGLVVGTVNVTEKVEPQPSPEETIIPVVYYRAHVQNIGWQRYDGNEWQTANTGDDVGTHGQSLRMEAIEIAVPEDYEIAGIAHVQNLGDIHVKKDRSVSLTGADGKEIPYDVYFLGTTGKGLRVEAMQINMMKGGESIDFDLSYETHVQNIGWMGFVPCGGFAGTKGQGLRMEALRMRVRE